MGYFFQAVDTADMIEKFSLENYVETGTGIGECLEYALRHPFENFYSVEIHDVVYKNAKEKFDKLATLYGRECEIYHGNSFDTLPEILEELEGNTLFFLDAHFPEPIFISQSMATQKIMIRACRWRERSKQLQNYETHQRTCLFLMIFGSMKRDHTSGKQKGSKRASAPSPRRSDQRMGYSLCMIYFQRLMILRRVMSLKAF